MTDNQNVDKSMVLHLINLINTAPKEVIDILRTTPVCNIKMVRQAAKNEKDPNPLSSMMSTINTAYPITADKEKLLALNVPNTYYHADKTDSHRHNRLLVKKETIDWYIEHMPDLDEEKTEIVDILRSQHLKDVKAYFNHNWEISRIQFGKNIFERKASMIIQPVVEIPREDRTQTLTLLFAPQHGISYYGRYDRHVASLQQIKALTIKGKLMLAHQIRMVLRAITPQIRTLPVMGHFSPEIMPMRYALAQRGFLVRTLLKGELETPNNEIDLAVENIGKIFVYMITVQDVPLDTALRAVKSAKFFEKPYQELVRDTRMHKSQYVKLMKAHFAYPTTYETVLFQVAFTPVETNIQVVTRRSIDGFSFKAYLGEEKVDFEFLGTKGTFNKIDCYPTSIKASHSERSSLEVVIGAMAVYTRYLMESTRAESKFKLFRNHFDYYRDRPWEFIHCERKEWYAMDFYTKKLGIIEFQDEIEFSPVQKLRMFANGIELSIPGSFHMMVDIPNLKDIKEITPQISVSHAALFEFLEPQYRLTKCISLYAANIEYIRGLVKDGNFTFRNNNVNKGIRGALSGVIMTCQRLLLMWLNEKQPVSEFLVALWYFFSNGVLDPRAAHILTFRWYDEEIDLLGMSGVIKTLGGKLIVDRLGTYDDPLQDRTPLIYDLLPGYRLKIISDKTSSIKTSTWLERNAKQIKDGTTFNVYITGHLIEATRDSLIDKASTDALKRQLKETSIFSEFINLGKLSKRAKVCAETSSVSSEGDISFGSFEDMDVEPAEFSQTEGELSSEEDV